MPNGNCPTVLIVFLGPETFSHEIHSSSNGGGESVCSEVGGDLLNAMVVKFLSLYTRRHSLTLKVNKESTNCQFAIKSNFIFL